MWRIVRRGPWPPPRTWYRGTANKGGMAPLPPLPVCDIGRLAMQAGGQLPLSKVIHNVLPTTRQEIMKSGKGLEGYIRQFTDFFEVTTVNGEKRLTVLDKTVDFGLPPESHPPPSGQVSQQKPAASVPRASFSTKPATATAAPAAPPIMTATVQKTPQRTVGPDANRTAVSPGLQKASPELPKASSAPPKPSPELPKASSAPPKPSPDPQKASNIISESPTTDKVNSVDARSPPQSMHPKSDEGGSKLEAPTPRTEPSETTHVVAEEKDATGKPSSGLLAEDVPCAANNWAGWASPLQVPTAADVFEMLKYIPIHWTNFSNLAIPADLKRRHIRVASSLAWFARLPRYFDVRVVAGTIEIRRSVLLHPEAHKLTKEEAEKIVNERIKADREAGEPIPLKAARSSTSTPKGPTASAIATVMPPTASDPVSKALLRICPGYYITSGALFKRATRRLTLADLVDAAGRNKAHIEMLHVRSKTLKGAEATLFRRRMGVDASTWEADFSKELEMSSNLDLLISCMTLCCAQWDRLHFLYVRLPDEHKIAIGGFDGMVEFLKAHPHVFVVGQYFFKRMDPSDPNFDPAEPQSNAITSTKQLEDNPYHQVRDIALVFHYLTPENQPCSLAHYVECASPCIKSVLPPRLITIIQAHPELFKYREISPGMFAISRTVAEDSTTRLLSPEETLAEVIKLVPPRGIDASHLQSSLAPQLHAAVVRHYGREGINELVSRHIHLFHVVRNPPYVTLFLKKTPPRA